MCHLSLSRFLRYVTIPAMNFIETLQQRGLVQDISDLEGMNKGLKSGDKFYVGFDPTAPYLHIGNLLQITVCIHLAKAGLRPILLFGGATGSIGDPSGRSEERQLLERDVIDRNVDGHKRMAQTIFDRFDVKVEYVNNLDWTRDVSVLEFLRDIGKHFTVNYMIAKEVVKTRLNGDGISFTEFSYMLLQAYDFLHLHKQMGCKLQFGGSDQWGNITAGLELIRKKGQGEAYAFSVPLVTDSQGKKFGKSVSGAVWINPEALSPYKFHQFWLNVEDADAVRYLRIFTFHDLNVLREVEERGKNAPEKREAQNLLADSVCTIVHGKEATENARKSAQVLFGGSVDGLSDGELKEIFSDVPSTVITKAALASTTFVDLLVQTKLVQSKGEARRLIESGGAYLNNTRMSDGTVLLENTAIKDRSLFVLRSGKKNYHLVQLASS